MFHRLCCRNMASNPTVKSLKLKIKLKKDGGAEITPPEDRRRENVFDEGRERKRQKHGGDAYRERGYEYKEAEPRRGQRRHEESAVEDEAPALGKAPCKKERPMFLLCYSIDGWFTFPVSPVSGVSSEPQKVWVMIPFSHVVITRVCSALWRKKPFIDCFWRRCHDPESKPAASDPYVHAR